MNDRLSTQSQDFPQEQQPAPTTPVTFQLFTPGSDTAIAFRPDQFVWGRTGNDVVVGYQADREDEQAQTDILVGDLAVEDPQNRTWSDTFILGDWWRPYYSAPATEFNNLSLDNLNTLDAAIITDFDRSKDTLQLHGRVEDYQLLGISSGTAVLRTADGQIDLVALLPFSRELDLAAPYFQFESDTPPPVELSEVQSLGSTAYDIPLAIATDLEQGVYVAGGTNGDLFEQNLGLRDNFIVKYNIEGEELFSLQFGTSDFDTIYGIETDNQNNFYITGVTAGDLAGEKQAEELDTFVAKYNQDGEQQWIRQIGQNVLFNAFNLAVNPDTGDVVISGADLKNSGEDDTFVIQFDTNGQQQWATETGNPGTLSFDESYGLTIANDGSVYAGGWTSGDLTPADGQGNQGLYDNWLAKYDPLTGEQQWTAQYGTDDYEWLWDIETDSSGAVYTTGWTLGDLEGVNQGEYDAYLTKFDRDGSLIWTQQFGTTGDDQAYSLHIDDADRIFIGGYTDSDLQGQNAGSFDAWIAQYDQEGQRQWVEQFGTSDRDELYGLASDTNGNLYATGITQGSAGALNAGSFDGWTAKLDAQTGVLMDFGSDRLTGIVPGTEDANSNDDLTQGGEQQSIEQILEVLGDDSFAASLESVFESANTGLTAIDSFDLGSVVETGEQAIFELLGQEGVAIAQDYLTALTAPESALN